MLDKNDMYIREDFDGNDYKKYMNKDDNPKVLRCCFAGHLDLGGKSEEIRKRLKKLLAELWGKYNFIECCVGNYGEFDRLAAGTVHSMTKKENPMGLVLIIPCLTTRIPTEKNKYYDRFDKITVANIPQGTPQRLGIIKANHYMVDKCDCLI